MALNWITAFKIIPWGQVLENAPTVLRSAKKLWDKAGNPHLAPAAPSRLEQEVSELRDEVARGAQLIAALAEQNAQLVGAIDVLRVRTRVLAIACVTLSVAVVALAAVAVWG
jgi:hypothetical protein